MSSLFTEIASNGQSFCSLFALGASGEPELIWGGFGEALRSLGEALGSVGESLGKEEDGFGQLWGDFGELWGGFARLWRA